MPGRGKEHYGRYITCINKLIGIFSIEKKIKTLYPFLSNTVDIRYESTEDFFSLPGPVPTDDISLCFIALDEDNKLHVLDPSWPCDPVHGTREGGMNR